jgi:spore coat protein CotH
MRVNLVVLVLSLGQAGASVARRLLIAGLHDVRLVLHSSDWQNLKNNFLDNTYYPTDLSWGGVTVRNVGIRSRGLGSRSPVKPGLRVDFDRYASGQRFLGAKSIILDNLTQDPSMMREVLSRASSPAWACRLLVKRSCGCK